jgi:hypothetical protein
MGRATQRGGEAVRRTVISILLCLSALCLTGCGNSYEWNQKLTVTVETPSGEISGAAVVGVSVSFQAKVLPDAHGLSEDWRGEATMVDLGNGRYLFALLGRPPGLAQAVFKELLVQKGGEAKRFYAALSDLIRAPAPVPSSAFPMLVTFADINDPKTVTKLDPANLAAAFGPGYALKGVTLEITDEAVTKGAVEKVLGWMRNYYDKMLSGERLRSATSHVIADTLSQTDFLRD